MSANIHVHASNETGQLKAVVLGIPDQHGVPSKVEEIYDPKSLYFFQKGDFPTEDAIRSQMNAFDAVLKKYGVQVFRPTNIGNYNQVFARDISFVIDDKFFLTNIIEDRSHEVEGIQHIINQIDPAQVVHVPADCRIEGGDVLLCGDYLLVGYSEEPDFSTYKVARTNRAGLEFLRAQFPNKTVKGFELTKSDSDPFVSALHLDCCFQPVGTKNALLFEGGFKNAEDVDWMFNFFGRENIIEASRQELFDMGCNVFSISPTVVVSSEHLTRVNEQLRLKGFTVEEIPYFEVGKMGGLFRCSTMPLIRE